MQLRPVEELLKEVSVSDDPEGTIRSHIFDVMKTVTHEPGERWRPGEPLKLFLAGYNGSGNTGADVRVSEMVRQLRTIVGAERFAPGLLLVKEHLPQDMFPDVAFEVGDAYLPVLLAQKTRSYHGVVTCEGSMFKSSHADLFTTLMASALGFGGAAEKPAIGYGADAGRMNPELERFVAETCRDALVISRSKASADLLNGLGLRVEEGADSAWTFDPAPRERAEDLMRTAGWDGHTPILGIAPINPFWWPARIDPQKAREMEETGAHAEFHFGSGVFHESSPRSQERYARYLDGIAEAVNAYARNRPVFPALFCMERLDARACKHLSDRLDRTPPVFSVHDRHPRDMVAALRLCDVLVSSRFHAIVTAMPGAVPAIGLTMDERIRNLFHESGQEARTIRADDDALGDTLLALLNDRDAWREEAAEAAERTTAREVRRMGRMGVSVARELRRHHPELELAVEGEDWETHLPPLPPHIESLLARHA